MLGVLNKGDLDGQQNLFQDNHEENFVQALQDTYVCSINRRDFQDLLKKTPDLAINMLNNFGEKLVAIETKSIRRNSMSAKDRLLAYLEDLAKKQGRRDVQLKLKKKRSGQLFGCYARNLKQAIEKKLAKENRIKLSGRKIILL